MVWCGGIAGDGGLDAVHSGGGGSDCGGGHGARLGGLRRGGAIT